MSVLTSGRSEPCKGSASGIKELWLAPFVLYDLASIVGYREALISNFPPTIMYEFQGQEKEFSEQYDNDWQQRITISMSKLNYLDSVSLMDVVNLRVRAVIVGWDDSIQVVGLHNGLDAEVESSTGQALEDFSGYRMTLTGGEPYTAPYLTTFPLGSIPDSGFAKKGGLDLECFLAGSSLVSSTSEKTASCNIIA